MTDYSRPILDHILLPTDFSVEGQVAFHHALKLALLAKTQLTLLHITPERELDWDEFPSVREPLEHWGLIAPGSPQTAVTDLGLKVRKVVTESEHPVQGVLHYMERHPPDLIVLKTTVNDGRMQWFRQSEAKPLSLKSGQISLILPSGVDGFVSAQDGSFQLNQVLIPVAHDPDPTAAVNAAVRFAVRTAAPTGTFHLLHIGSDPEDAPRVDPPEVPGWVWKRSIVPGPVVDTIAQVAREDGADLIIMATNGRDGFLDALRGSHSERLLHKTPCPIATIPEGSNLRFELGG